MDDLLKESKKVFEEHQENDAWFGRCIFLSWYCDVGTCDFCYRSTQKNRIKNANHAKRSLGSVIVEALIAKELGWRIEFLTGGYNIYPKEDLFHIIKLVSKVYGEKIWLNLGAIDDEDIKRFRPYIKGIVASIETPSPKLHGKICPDKPVDKYEDMLVKLDGLQKSMTMIVGLGETHDEFIHLKEFIKKHNLDRITFYALKPVKDTPYTKGPSTEEYLWWVANTRIAFPDIQIITGVTFRRVTDNPEEIRLLMDAGSNAITKFPITKKFNSEEAKDIERMIGESGRNFLGSLTKLPDIEWDSKVDGLDIEDGLKETVKNTLGLYLKKMADR